MKFSDKIKISLLLLLPFFAIHFTTQAKNIHYYFKQISIEQGLSQASITSILRNDEGVIWIGTKSGLNCYDEGELKIFFNIKDDRNSLPGNRIYTIAQDSLKQIWVSTNNGLVVYNEKENSFKLILKDIIYSFSDIPGGMLFGGKKQLYLYSYKDRKITDIVDIEPSSQHIDVNFSITKMQKIDSERIVFATNQSGLYTFNPTNFRIEKLPFGNIPTLTTMFIASNGYYYLSSFRNGLYCFNQQGELIRHYLTNNSGLSNNIIMSIVENDNCLWLATDGGGIDILDLEKDEITSIQHIPGDNNSLPVNSVTLLYKDKENNLWAGSVRGGVFAIKMVSIRTYKDAALNTTYGLSEKAVISLHEDKNGILWIGTDGGGINRYNPYTGEFKHYPSTYRDKVISIVDLSDSELLVSLFEKGTFIFHKETEKYTPFTIVNNQINIRENFSGFMPLIYKVSEDKIYIFSQGGHIYIPSEKRFTPLKTSPGEEIPNTLNLFYHDDQVGYAITQNKIFEINQKNDSLYLIYEPKADETINSMTYGKENSIWIGSNYGLSRYSLKSGELERIDTRLFSNVSHLLSDEKNRLWICAQNMLFSYIPEENRFVVRDESDGFLPNEILTSLKSRPETGRIYLGGTDGLAVIDENVVYDDNFQPQISFRDIELNGISALQKQKGNHIKIPYNYNSLLIKVNANEKDIFRKILFRYKITGMNNNVFESYDHSLNLSSLSPGDYRVAVSCNTKSGDWGPEAILNLEVVPPWFRSPWFITGLILFISLVVILIVRSVIKKNETEMLFKMKEHEQEVNESKIRFLVNISHELRTPLTLIYAPLKRLIRQSSDEWQVQEVKENLDGIFKQTSLMKDVINMVLDINKMDEGLSKLNLAPHRFNQWVQSIAEDFRKEFEKKEIQLYYELNDNIGELLFDEDKCKIVLSNFLINALKFTPPNKKVRVGTNLTDTYVKVSVSDEGIGLSNVDMKRLFSRFYQGDHDKKGNGIGLSYSKQLITLHNGTIGACNNAEEGATFYFDLPILLTPENSDSRSLLAKKWDDNNNITVSSEEVSSYSLENFSILIVEDNNDFRTFLKKELTGNFKHVYSAKDGMEALDLIHEKQPDLVVSDVMMPEMDGFELCKKIKEDIKVSHIPVILLTARIDTESISTGYKMGADFYLSKPFDIDILLTIIKNQMLNRDRIKQLYKENFSFAYPVEMTTSYADEQFLLKLNGLINDNIDKTELDASFLAGKMNMGRTSFYNKIKNLTGMGVNDYINNTRIERASYLLIHTKLDISEIAYDLGFSYQRYFSTLFKKMKGISPSEFRERNSIE